MGPHDADPLPARARNWVQARAPRAVVDIVAIDGGITGTKWLVHLDAGDPVVVRWEDPEVWGAVGLEHVRREALALRLLADSALPLPRLIATDPTGSSAGGPANLMSWRPGQVRLDRLGAAAIAELARLAVAVHGRSVHGRSVHGRSVHGQAVHGRSVPDDLRPPTFSFRGPPEPQVPDWARRPELWRQAIELRMTALPATPYGLLHRDFHLGNVLWQGDTVSGLIDWAEISWGPPDLDVAHACSDFAMLHTIADVEAFRSAYVREGGRLDPDPDAARFWLVSDILGFLPDPAHILPGMATRRPDLSPKAVRHGLEDLLGWTLS